jgi:hypothetical protein
MKKESRCRSGYLRGVFFGLDDGGNKFLTEHLTNYRPSITEDRDTEKKKG